jgi:drug/metabolite transporter (DMT)-like permease
VTARTRAYLLLIFVAVIWGIAPPVIKYTLPYFPTAIFLTYRFFIICLLMIPFLLIHEPKTWHVLGGLTHRDWLILIISGLLGSTLQLGLLFWGLELTTSLDGSLINATSPILVALAGHYLLKENIPFRERIGHVIAFIGTIIVVIQPVFEGHRLFSGSMLGNLLTLTGTVAWVGYVLLTKVELQHKLTPLLLTTFMFFIGFISLSVISFFLYSPLKITAIFNLAPLSAHLGVLFMALISGALAYWAYQAAQKCITVAEANIFLYLPPIFTLPLAYFWLHEKISLFFVLGSLVIAFGVGIAEIRSYSRRHVV